MPMTTKQQFADYAWKGSSSGKFLESLRDVEGLVHRQDTNGAILRVLNLFQRNPDPPTEHPTWGCELERFGDSRSPVRSALIYALAAIKHENMSQATSMNSNMSDGPRSCIYKMFKLFTSVRHINEASKTFSSNAILQFILKLMMVTYKRVSLFVDPTFEHYDAVASSRAANFIAVSCNFLDDPDAVKYSSRAANLVSGAVICDDEVRATIYQTAGESYRKKNDSETAKIYFTKAREFAEKMPDMVKNKAKDDLLHRLSE